MGGGGAAPLIPLFTISDARNINITNFSMYNSFIN